MNEYFASIGGKKRQPKPTRTFKLKRSQMQHAATLKDIATATAAVAVADDVTENKEIGVDNPK